MPYKYLLFDADNTLFDFDKCEENAFLSISDVMPDVFTTQNYSLYHDINDSFWKEAEKGNISKDKLKIERFKCLLERLDVYKPTVSAEELSKIYLERLSQQNELICGAIDVLKYLYTKYEIYIVTNGIATVQRSRFANSPIQKYIKRLFISEEIGFNKPDVRYFNSVFNEIGSRTFSEYLIIGDSLSSDIEGANNAKIDSVYFMKKPPYLSTDRAKYNIISLDELKDIL